MENFSNISPWSFPDSPWISSAFARDTDAVTRALQISLSDDSSASLPSLPSPDTVSVASSFLADPSPSYTPPPSRNPISASPKITKRKSRASKQAPKTTFINADPANFRQMVQQVTGVRIGAGAADQLLKPEPVRAGSGRVLTQHSCLPTLDTSAYLMDRVITGAGSAGPAAGTVEGIGFDFEPFMSFPTLESWSVMQMQGCTARDEGNACPEAKRHRGSETRLEINGVAGSDELPRVKGSENGVGVSDQIEGEMTDVAKGGNLEMAKNLAVSMASKAALLARDLKTVKSVLQFL